MASDVESTTSSETELVSQSKDWLKIGIVAVASALAGGVAAAWWYRKTLAKLRQAGEGVPHASTEASEESKLEAD